MSADAREAPMRAMLLAFVAIAVIGARLRLDRKTQTCFLK